MEQIVQQFNHLHRALIDASSIIYMMKAGFFDCLADNVNLYSPEQILGEAGYRDLKIQPIGGCAQLRSADESLLHCAALRKYPVITEDRGIIRQLAKDKIAYFNALMMLEFIFFRGLITPEKHSAHLQKLLQYAWYSPEIVRFGKAVHRRLEGDRQ